MIDTPPEPPAAQEQVIERKLLECGLKAGGFSVRYENYLGGIEVVIGPAANATPDHFACIRDVVFPEFVRFENFGMSEQYDAYAGELLRPQTLADAEEVLKALGLWEGFPDGECYATLADYARALEDHAGWEPGSAIRAEGEDTLIFDPPRSLLAAAETVENYKAILVVLIYAAADARLKLGFIGNEKLRE